MSSNDIAVAVRGLSKSYVIDHNAAKHTTLTEAITHRVKNPLQRPEKETFWALKDIEFDVKKGDVVGIIGRNGAGKSTLLKVLSQITEPTTGEVRLYGRVGSLLEVGTGFHPELTGRENIYLNGAILGMRKKEIDSQFDKIVDFAEVEQFLDTPVKRYSSGMYVRLAFAVAAHLNPEILMVDEVLSVGDAQFQKKCLGKMQDVSQQEGKTVLFVSHNMSAIRALCNKGITLSGGEMKKMLDIEDAIDWYLRFNAKESASVVLSDDVCSKPRFDNIKLNNTVIDYGESLLVDFEISTPYSTDVGIEIEIHDEKGIPVAYSSTTPMDDIQVRLLSGQSNPNRLKIGPINMASGAYSLYFWLIRPWAENYHTVKQPLSFRVELSDPFKSGFAFRQSFGRGCTTFPIEIVR